jgi:hypothetical protein
MLLCSCVLCAQLPAQTSPSPSPTTPPQPAAPKSPADLLVDQLVENYAALRAMLPSITAHQKVETHFSRGILWQNSTGEGTVRILRASSGEGLKETHEMTVLNGKPIAPDEQKAQAQLKKGPAQPSDALFGVQDAFFSLRNRPCFSFTLASQPAKDGTIELHFAHSPEYASMPKCQPGLEGLTGIARIDPATHQLTHLEYATPTQVGNTAPFASTDYAPAKIGDKTFWLPAVTAASYAVDNAKVHVHTTTHFSDYHQYTATSTILPATPE